MKPKIIGIILAAGQSSRMVIGNKLLLAFHNKSILEKTIENANNAEFYKIIGITGHQHTEVSKVFNKFNVELIHNISYKKGVSSSIIKGIKYLSKDIDGAMICLGDMPKISTETYNLLIRAFKKYYTKNMPLIIIPSYDKNNGNPIIFSNYFFLELTKLSGDKGAKGLVKKSMQYTKLIKIKNASILEDIDELESYEKLLNNE